MDDVLMVGMRKRMGKDLPDELQPEITQDEIDKAWRLWGYWGQVYSDGAVVIIRDSEFYRKLQNVLTP